MTVRFETRIAGEECALVGSLLELDDLRELDFELEKSSSQVSIKRLNFADLKAINSLGLRALMLLMQKPEAQHLEFHECKSVILDAINLLPAVLGKPYLPTRVRSIHVEADCDQCAKGRNILIKLTGQPLVEIIGKCATVKCPKCQSLLTMRRDLGDELFFLSESEC